jgi:hypothetical protein
MIQMLAYLLAAVGIFAVAVMVVAFANRLPFLTSFQVKAEFKRDEEGQERPKLRDVSEQ